MPACAVSMPRRCDRCAHYAADARLLYERATDKRRDIVATRAYEARRVTRHAMFTALMRNAMMRYVLRAPERCFTVIERVVALR